VLSALYIKTQESLKFIFEALQLEACIPLLASGIWPTNFLASSFEGSGGGLEV